MVCAFSLCKRGLTGAFHKVSLKHLQRYLNVFSYRFNNRKDANLFGMTVRRMALAGNLRALEVCVLRFYSRIFWSAASDYKSVNAKLQVVGAIALSAIELLSRQWADKISNTWEGLSPLWSLLPIGLFVAYRMLRANYLEFHALEQRLKAQQDEEETQSRLGNLLNESSELREEVIRSEAHFDTWVNRFDAWREVLNSLGSFGLAADYSLFQNADTMRDEMAEFPIDWDKQIAVYDERLKHYMHALAGIIKTRPRISF